MKKQWIKASVILMLIGATVGTLLDGVHTHTHTIEYASPLFWMAAWWTPLIFANASLMTGISRPLAETVLGLPPVRPLWREVMAVNAVFYVAYLLSGLLPLGDWGKTVVLALIWLGMWLKWDRTLLGVALSLATAILGPLTEHFLSSQGAFRYLNPNFFDVVSWLPVLNAIASLASGKLGQALVYGTQVGTTAASAP